MTVYSSNSVTYEFYISRWYCILSLTIYIYLIKYITPGENGGWIYFVDNFFQFILFIHGWCFISSMPLNPNLLYLFLFSNLLTKSTHYELQSEGKSSKVIFACCARILSLIYFLESPMYGLRPKIISYTITPKAK